MFDLFIYDLLFGFVECDIRKVILLIRITLVISELENSLVALLEVERDCLFPLVTRD